MTFTQRGSFVRFSNRSDAGRRLAEHLRHLRGEPAVVLGLPRGGVPVAREVADALGAPLDVILVRKLGVPVQPELAMGAIGEDGVEVTDERIMRSAGVTERQLAEVEARERVELERRVRRFRGDRPRLDLTGRTAIVVDDGIATGSTARAACAVARAHGAARIVLAVPVAPVDWTRTMAGAADELVCVATPEPFGAIGRFYADFDQTTDEEVLACLERSGGADTPAPAEPSRTEEPGIDTDLAVRLGPAHLHSHLPGHLTVPPGATGLVLFAHGSGSSRHSPRNQYVAGVLNDAGVGTYLFDLLTPHEADDRENVFDIDLLGSRLAGATRALLTRPELDSLAIGYFGASTGAAAALWAASEPDLDIAAVVSRGGRPDLAERRLARVEAPTLLIVGGDDHVVADLNRRARAELRSCPSDLVVIPGAGHLFEEPGTLAAAAAAARDWFVAHLGAPASRPI